MPLPPPRTNLLPLAATVLLLFGCGSEAEPLDGSVEGGMDASTTDDAGDAGGQPDGAAPDGGEGCPGLTRRCGDACVVASVDPDNCGACGVVCGAGQACVSNGCVDSCPPGLTLCDRSCVDTDSDSAHCGTCGTACGADEGCMDGACVPSIPLGPAPAKCEGGGPPIVVRDAPASEGTCADRTAGTTFLYGLCSCGDVGLPRLSSETAIDAYDSESAPYVPGGSGGSLGANGSVETTELDISGDVRVAGADGLRVGPAQVGQQLWVANDLQSDETLLVGEEARVGGEVSGTVEITGELRTPDCGAVPGDVTSAGCTSGAVTVDEPCACDPDEIVPIGTIVDFYSADANNDNALISLSSDVFTTTGGPRRLDLPCGYYYLDEISGAVTIAAHGRTALFVGGDVDASAAMAFVVDPGATLDVFVAGTLHTTASLRVGSPAYPRNVRFYVGGTDSSFDPPRSVDFESEVDLAGLFYAPNGAVVSSSSLEMYGAVFAGEFHNTASTSIHYDAAATRLGEDCPDIPGDGCGSCGDCDNQACIDGMCSACTDDSQCCSPLRCLDGTCAHIVF